MKTYSVKDVFTDKNHFAFRDNDIDTLLPKKLPVRKDIGYMSKLLGKPTTIAEMFPKDTKPFTLQQVEKILLDDKSELSRDGWSNFFLVDNAVALRAGWDGDGARWYVCARRFDYVYRWRAECRVLLSDTPIPSKTSSLESRVKALEDWKEKVIKSWNT